MATAGAGKTDIALRLAANVARGASDWLAHEIAFGKVLFISGEEPERELRRRMWQHSQRDGYSLDVLADNFRLWIPDEIHDAAMAIADRYNSIMRPTRIMQEIAAAILNLAPILVVVDNVAATFAGNQNDRVSVRSFVNLWRQIAHGPSKPAVLLLDHPSLSGLTSNTGRGGNMDWRNAVRSALWLHPPTEGAEADRGIRILETAKSNYGPPGNPLRLIWAEGGLQLEHTLPSHHRAAKDAECEDAFLRLLDQREGQGRHVSGQATAPTYAPKAFVEMPDNGGFARKAFAAAMERLLTAGKIVQVMEGPASRQRGRLIRRPVWDHAQHRSRVRPGGCRRAAADRHRALLRRPAPRRGRSLRPRGHVTHGARRRSRLDRRPRRQTAIRQGAKKTRHRHPWPRHGCSRACAYRRHRPRRAAPRFERKQTRQQIATLRPHEALAT
jgi:hypothetical protein